MKLPTRVRIVSTGTPYEAHVYDADTGEEVRNVTKIDVLITPDGAKGVLYIDVRHEVEFAAADFVSTVEFADQDGRDVEAVTP